MSDESPQILLLREMARVFQIFRQEGDLAPIEDGQEWETLVESKPTDERELLRELARFADLWKYLRQHNESLGSEIVDSIGQLRKLNVCDRTQQLKEINQKLLERVIDAGEGARFRH